MTARVLFVDHTGAIGGAELILLDLAVAFRETSTVVLLADGPFRQRLEEEGVRVTVLQGSDALHAVRRESSGVSLRAAAEAIRLAWRLVPLARKHDCIHANTQKAFPIACLAGAIARKPVIWDLNDLMTPEHFSPRMIALDVMLARRCAAGVVANSHASADALIAQGGPADRIHVLHDGVDAAPFDAIADADVAAVRAEFGVGTAPLIGVFGRLAEWKGQHVALEALAALPDAHLLIVGDALFGEQEYVTLLRERTATLGLNDRVHFAGFRRDIPRLMRAVDVVVHTSTAAEPFGRVIVEGMLARRPVVATRGGGVDEIVDSGVTGITVPPGDSAELARVLQILLDEPQRRDTLATAGRHAAEERFSVASMVHGMSRHIERMAQR